MLRLSDELFLQFIKEHINLDDYESVIGDIKVVDCKATESLVNGFEEIKLYGGRVVLFLESKIKEELLKYLYKIESFDSHTIDENFVEHSVSEFLSEVFDLKQINTINAFPSRVLYKYAAYTKLFSREVYVCVDEAFVNKYLVSKHSVNPKLGVNQKVIKSIIDNKTVKIDIGLLNQDVDMSEVLNIKVGDVIKTNRRKEEGVQIIHDSEVLAQNVFVSSGEIIKVIVG
ncbi:hypothetical protein ACOIWI_000522 [Vibrio vulnificus]|nr:hypothetical protein [Vibrio vulnificus]ELX4197061.1 hypothetical protein [Vibrio vulnificus]